MLARTVLWIAVAVLAAKIAYDKNHNALPWALIGLLLGPFAVCAALDIKRKEPEEVRTAKLGQ